MARKMVPVLLTALVGAILVVVGGAATQSASAHVACPHSWVDGYKAAGADVRHAFRNYNYRVDGARIRTGNSTNCTAVGQGYRSHNLMRLYCYEPDGTHTWSRIYDHDAARGGFVRDDLLYAVAAFRC